MSGLKIILKKVKDYSKAAQEASGLPTWTLALIIFGVLLIIGIPLGVFIYWSKKHEANRVQTEVFLKKPDQIKPKSVIKQVDEIKPKKSKKEQS